MQNIVDLTKYTGLWYDITHTRSFFQIPGSFNTTALYTLNKDGTIKVINNTYYAVNNQIVNFTVSGVATPLNNFNNKLLLTFPESLTPTGKVPSMTSYYNIVKVFSDSNDIYMYSIVSGNDKSTLYILSRIPFPSPSIIDKMILVAKSLGYNTKLDYTDFYL